MSDHQRKQSLRVASIPEEQFNKAAAVEAARERQTEAGGWHGNQHAKPDEAVSADRREAPTKPKPSERKASAQAAKAVGASAKSVERYKRVKEKAPVLHFARGMTGEVMGQSFHTKLAGVTHSNSDGTPRQKLVKQCRSGQRLKARRAPENEHDPHAIEVWSDSGMLGYLPGGDARLADHMDKGGGVTLTVSEVTGGASFLQRLFGRQGKSYGCNVLVVKEDPDWNRIEPWMEADRKIRQLIKDARRREKDDADEAVALYREAVQQIEKLDAQGSQASAWRSASYPINRLSLTLEKAGRHQESLEEIERWEQYEDTRRISDSDASAVEKRKARLLKRLR